MPILKTPNRLQKIPMTLQIYNVISNIVCKWTRQSSISCLSRILVNSLPSESDVKTNQFKTFEEIGIKTAKNLRPTNRIFK